MTEDLVAEERGFAGDASVRRILAVGVDLPGFALDGGDNVGCGDAGVGVVGTSAGGARSGKG